MQFLMVHGNRDGDEAKVYDFRLSRLWLPLDDEVVELTRRDAATGKIFLISETFPRELTPDSTSVPVVVGRVCRDSQFYLTLTWSYMKRYSLQCVSLIFTSPILLVGICH